MAPIVVLPPPSPDKPADPREGMIGAWPAIAVGVLHFQALVEDATCLPVLDCHRRLLVFSIPALGWKYPGADLKRSS